MVFRGALLACQSTNSRARRLLFFTPSSRRAALRAVSLLVFLLLPLHLAQADSITALPPVLDADGRLGLCDVLPGPISDPTGESWAQVAYDAGARLDRWEFRWDKLEPAPGQWDFTTTDADVQSATQAGLGVEGILIGTPGWAVRQGQKPGNGVPKGLYLNYADPQNLWAEYVRATVSQYSGQVSTWEIWNEPDIAFFWSGTPADYFQLLKVAYQTIKSIEPRAKVITGGMVDPGMTFAASVFSVDAQDTSSGANNGYFDVAAWHAYGPAEQLYTNLQHFKFLLSSNRIVKKPIWVTEAGFPASNPSGEPRQAAYVLQTIAYALAAGASKILVYRASDDTTSKEWGLMAADGTPRMGYLALQVAAQYFAHEQSVVYDPGPHTEQFSVYGPDQRTFVLWSHDVVAHQVRLAADTPYATLVDWQGNESSIAAVNGEFDVTLPGAAYNVGIDPAGAVVGGPPILLKEDTVPASGLSLQSHLAPVSGTSRRLVLFNPGSSAVEVSVSANGHAAEQETLQLGSRAVRNVDLDLLAGSRYTGFYNVATSGIVSDAAYSSTFTAPSLHDSPLWYVARGTVVTIGNTSSKLVSAGIVVFGKNGMVRSRASLNVAPEHHVFWTVPDGLLAAPHALMIRGSAPISVVSAPSSATAAPQSTWYSLRPQAARLTVFNPNASLPARIEVRFVGAKSVERKLVLKPHRSIDLPQHAARAVVLTSSQPVVTDYSGPASSNPPLTSQSSTQTDFPVAGSITSMLVYNPSTRAAHVSLTSLGGAQPVYRTIVVGRQHVATFHVRSLNSGSRGVIEKSDVPVVVTPSG